MYLQFYINETRDKVYTTKKDSPIGLATQSTHPEREREMCWPSLLQLQKKAHTFLARFSLDDKHLKKRFGLLSTQKPAPKYRAIFRLLIREHFQY